MSNFFCIEVINDAGEVGFLVDSPDGLKVSLGAVVSDIKQFDKPKDADDFIRKHNLNAKKARAKVRDGEYLSKYMSGKGITTLDKLGVDDVYFIESEEGHRVFFDAKQQGYYLDKKDVGFCCWKTKQDTEDFIEYMDFPIKLYTKPMSSLKK